MYLDAEFIRQQIYQELDLKDTNELIEIWKADGCNLWPDGALSMIKEILQKRNVVIPKQYPKGNIKRIKIKSLRPKNSFHYSIDWESISILIPAIGLVFLGFLMIYSANDLLQNDPVFGCTDFPCAPGGLQAGSLIFFGIAIWLVVKFFRPLSIKKEPNKEKIPTTEACLNDLARLIKHMNYLNYGKRRFFHGIQKFVINEAICSSCSNRFILGKALVIYEDDKVVTYLFTCPRCLKTSVIHSDSRNSKSLAYI